jgi:hypothetical protein
MFDTLYNFWSQVPNNSSLPAPAWGATGGIDPLYTSPTSQTHSIISYGGVTGSSLITSVEATVVSGQLSSNIATVGASYDALGATGSSPQAGVWGSAGALLPGSTLVVFSGCNTTNPQPTPVPSNATTDCPAGLVETTSILTFPSSFSPSSPGGAQPSWSVVQACPAPRLGASMVANLNGGNSAYRTQAFLIGGLIDETKWIESPSGKGGISAGEVGVLDTSSGTWARVVPQGNETMGPRSGAAVWAAQAPIPGLPAEGQGVTDILVWGGKDVVTGNTLNELWYVFFFSWDIFVEEILFNGLLGF